MKTIAEQIQAFETKKKSLEDNAVAIVQKALDEARTLDKAEDEARVAAITESKAIETHLAVLKSTEQLMLARAEPVNQDAGVRGAGDLGTDKGIAIGSGTIRVKGNLPPGLRFTRFALAMAQSKGNVMLAHEIAKSRFSDTPEVANVLKAAIGMGGTGALGEIAMQQKAAVTAVTTADSSIVQYNDMEAEFVDLLRPAMVMGRMTSLVHVPVYSRVNRQLTGVSGSFVGEGAPKPVGKQTYDNITLGPTKVAVIVVMSDEAIRFTTVKAEMRARDDMVKGIATYIDKRFLDPTYAGVAGISPASITHNATSVQSTGSTLAAIDADVRSVMSSAFATTDLDPSTAVWVMPAAVALRLSMKRNAYDEPAFPGLTMKGGDWYGLPVIVSNAMVTSGSPGELQIALVTQSEVMVADDGGISIDMSTEASVQMSDTPSAGAQSLVSLWQNNLLGIRAEQFINWAAMRTNNLGIALIENTNY